MKSEKSCGAIVYKQLDGEIEFLAIESKPNGHWGFPKGHMELNEKEEETALREVFEETGLRIRLVKGFKRSIFYKLQNGGNKEVVFFMGKAVDGRIKIQEEEIIDYKWLRYEEMRRLLTFESIRKILDKAKMFLEELPRD